MGLRAEHTHAPIADEVRDGIRLNVGRLPIAVSDDDRDGVFVATDGISTVYGAGENPDAAIDDYLDNLFTHFAYLDVNRDRLGPRLATELAALSPYFVREP
jgi:hypothetical protein